MILKVIVCIGGLLVASSMKAENYFNAFMYVIRGPLRSETNNWNDWATQKMQELYRNRSISGDVGWRLSPEYVMQSSALTNEALWFAVRITSKDPSVKLSLHMLRFSERSSDPPNSLDNAYVLDDTNIVYSPRALGVIWGPGGERSSDTIIDQGDATQLVDEIDFIGMQSSFFIYSLPEEKNGILEYILGFPNFLLTSECDVTDSDGTILAKVQRTLETKEKPFAPFVSLDIFQGWAVVGINMQTNRTAVIESKGRLVDNWTFEATVNAGDLIFRPMDDSTNQSCRFFRAYLE